MKVWKFGICAVALMLTTTACGPMNQTAGDAGNAVSNMMGTANNVVGNVASGTAGLAARAVQGVTNALPLTIAGAPTNLTIQRNNNPAQVKAVYSKHRIRVVSRSHWHGNSVTLYYLPATNLKHQGTHMELLQANGVQRIGTFPIDKNGHWSASWNMGNYKVPLHKPMYFLAVSDTQQSALVRTNTVS